MSDDVLENILEDTNQAIFVLQPNGTITHISQEAKKIFGITEDMSFNVLIQDERNDALSEFILESIQEKSQQHHSKIVNFFPLGSETPRMLEMKTVPARSPGTGKTALLVFVEDCTEREMLRIGRKDSSLLVALSMVYISLFLFLWELNVQFGTPVTPQTATDFALIMAAAVSFISIWKTSLRSRLKSDWTINKKTLCITIIALIAFTAFMIGTRSVLTAADIMMPLQIDWNYDFSPFRLLSYFFIALMQEFLARSFFQNSLQYVFWGKYSRLLAIICSSLIFGVLHLPFGFSLMFGAAALMGVLGLYYDKTHSIPSTTAVHFICGWMFMVLFL